MQNTFHFEIGPARRYPAYIHRVCRIDHMITKEKDYIWIPDGNFTLIFSLGTPYYIYTGANTERIGKSILVGQMGSAVKLKLCPGNRFIMVHLKPYGLHYFTGWDCTELKDRSIALENLFGYNLRSLSKYLSETPALAQCTDKIEDALSRISGEYAIHTLVRSGVDAIQANNGKGSIKDICRELGTTKTTLEKYFAKTIGISPKVLARLSRLQHFIEQKLANPHFSLTNATYESSYYDQSHLIKEFKLITGITPRKYFIALAS